MPGTGDIGGGSCTLEFRVWNPGGQESNPPNRWKCTDNSGQNLRYRIVPAGTPNTPGGAQWTPVPAGQELQTRWD